MDNWIIWTVILTTTAFFSYMAGWQTQRRRNLRYLAKARKPDWREWQVKTRTKSDSLQVLLMRDEWLVSDRDDQLSIGFVNVNATDFHDRLTTLWVTAEQRKAAIESMQEQPTRKPRLLGNPFD